MSTTLTAAVAPDDPSIPEPEPGVEKEYNNTFRILASNDEDPHYNTTQFETIEYDGNGSIRVVNKTVGTLPFELRAYNMRSTQALETAYGTDVYVTSLRDEAGVVPYKDTWRTLKDYRGNDFAIDTRIIPLNDVTYGEPTSTDGEFRVEVLNTNGYWMPVYEAEIKENDTEYYVANPEEALVHIPKGQYIISRKVDSLRALLRYSELAADEETAHKNSAIPMDDGDEVYPTADGASVTPVWQPGSHALVKDAYIGIMDVPPGVWYRDRYVTQTYQVNSYVPWDYRVAPPSDYSESDTCTHTHSRGNSTYTETHPKTNWANYRILDTDEEVNVTISNGTHTQEMYRLGGKGGVWSTYDDMEAELHKLAPGEYTITANLTVTVELEKHYGVSSSECHEWEQTTIVERTMTTTYSVPIRTVHSDSRNLSVDVTVYDKPGNDVVAVNWTGDQDLDVNPWRVVVIKIGEKRLHVDSPWHFYSVAQNTEVEERSNSGMSTFDASHSYGGRYPAMLRNRVSVANITVRLTETDNQRAWWRETYTVVDEEVPATTLPDTVIAPDNDNTTYLYDLYAGVYLSNDEAMGESVTVQAYTVFDAEIDDTEVEVVPYRESNLEVWLEEHNGETRLAMRLYDPETNDPLTNRVIRLQGANTSTVTTSSNGTAYAKPTGTVISAQFAGDDWRTPRSVYYLSDHAGLATGFGFTGAAEDIFGYIDVAISNLMLFVEWLALGVFALYWLRFRSKKPA